LPAVASQQIAFAFGKREKHLYIIVYKKIHMYLKRNKGLKVLSLYTKGYKKQFYLREISKLTDIALKTTQTTLARLEEENILKSEKRGKNKYFKLNLKNIQTKFYLIQSEIYKTELFLEKHPQFKTFLKSINSNMPIVVFGSFAKMTAKKESDLDLLLIGKKEIPKHLISNDLHKVGLTEKDFLKSLKNEEDLIKEIEENHIILNNHSFYVNTMWEYSG
jgi:predicted nucleotidyltransferase